MEGHRYFINGIPLALWKEYRQACMYFDTTTKDHLIGCMQDLVIRYHKEVYGEEVGLELEPKRERKK